jgi:cytochrome b561
MIALPLLGVLDMQAADKSLTFLGLSLPVLIGVNPTMAHDLKELHETVGNFMIALILLHVVAAFWHHLVLRDTALQRMLRPR